MLMFPTERQNSGRTIGGGSPEAQKNPEPDGPPNRDPCGKPSEKHTKEPQFEIQQDAS